MSADEARNRCGISGRTACGHRALEFVRPSAVNADIVVDGTDALDWKVERVMSEMRKRGLLTGAG